MNMQNQNYTTEQLAEALHGRPSSIRTRLCKTGSYYGIKPRKLPNGRLLWSVEDVRNLIEGAAL
jgi:hypothetical protein